MSVVGIAHIFKAAMGTCHHEVHEGHEEKIVQIHYVIFVLFVFFVVGQPRIPTNCVFFIAAVGIHGVGLAEREKAAKEYLYHWVIMFSRLLRSGRCWGGR